MKLKPNKTKRKVDGIVMAYRAKRYAEMVAQLNHAWPAPTHSAVAQETDIQLGCFLINLKPDGTYNLSDISG